MDELNAAMEAGTSDAVKMWMNWMGIVFIASLLFVWKHKTARYVLFVLVLTLPIGFGIWILTGNIHLLGITHLVVWLPLAIYIYSKELKSSDGTPFSARLKSPYMIWLCLLFATIVVSLVFDVRDIALVLMGQK